MNEFLVKTIREAGFNPRPISKLIDVGDEEIYIFPVCGYSTAYEVWDKLRPGRSPYKVCPVIIGGKHDLDVLNFHLSSHSANKVREIIRKASDLNVEDWKRIRAFEVVQDIIASQAYAEKMFGAMRGVQNIGGGQEEVYVALITGCDGWQIPAYLNFGGWEDCPKPEVHCALIKKWEGHYGAKILKISNDELVLAINSPPDTQELAIQASVEVLLYCTDHIPYSMQEREIYWVPFLYSNRWHFYWLNPGTRAYNFRSGSPPRQSPCPN